MRANVVADEVKQLANLDMRLLEGKAGFGDFVIRAGAQRSSAPRWP